MKETKMIAHMKLGERFGEQLTDIAREVAWFGDVPNPEKGMVMLMESCVGMTIDQARDIVEGRKKLVTASDSELKMVDDDWEPINLEKMEMEKRDEICGHCKHYRAGSCQLEHLRTVETIGWRCGSGYSTNYHIALQRDPTHNPYMVKMKANYDVEYATEACGQYEGR